MPNLVRDTATTQQQPRDELPCSHHLQMTNPLNTKYSDAIKTRQ
ncbi:hypothetical protein V6Z12_A05G006900 [Gossypium hirsutum]